MKISSLQKKTIKIRRRRILRVRRPILENASRPRLSVHRSNQYIYAQIINDQKKETLVAASDLKLKLKGTKIERAKAVGKELAEKAKKKKISKVVFDRGWYKFHGRVKALADSAREQGLIF
jgi:large subunit ribosomal protein L18